MRLERAFGVYGFFRQSLIYPLLGERDIVPIRLRHIFRPVEIQEFEAGFAVNGGKIAGYFILDIRSLVQTDKARPGIHVHKPYKSIAAVGDRLGAMQPPAAAFQHIVFHISILHKLIVYSHYPASGLLHQSVGLSGYGNINLVGTDFLCQNQVKHGIETAVGHSAADIRVVNRSLGIMDMEAGLHSGSPDFAGDGLKVFDSVRIVAVP